MNANAVEVLDSAIRLLNTRQLFLHHQMKLLKSIIIKLLEYDDAERLKKLYELWYNEINALDLSAEQWNKLYDLMQK